MLPVGVATSSKSAEPAELDLADLRSRLLDWYGENQRELPWRARSKAPDPYHVWLSEVMLQQTRAETVAPFFRRWLARFPTIQSVAEASQDEILKAWEGLGYYSRARNLHRAVRVVVETYGGEVPARPTAFRSLPGVGRYTSGAVMSIAFGLEEPLVDGNVKRVFARLLDSPRPSEDTLWELAARLVKGERPGDLNQALMELGATLCTPRSPECRQCPVTEYCRARAAGTQRSRPEPATTRRVPTEHHAVVVVERAGRLLVVRRPDQGRMAGLWEFPSLRREVAEELAEAALRAGRERAGVEVEGLVAVGEVRHALTHVRLVYEVVRASASGSGECGGDGNLNVAWVTPDELERLALARAQRRIAAMVAAGPDQVIDGGRGEPSEEVGR